VVEGTGLENRQARKRLEGSNPSPSAKFRWQHFDIYIDVLSCLLRRSPNSSPKRRKYLGEGHCCQ
jgi:hypothetical protein